MLKNEARLKNIHRINPVYLKALSKLEIFTVRDLLYHFPFRYEDYSRITPIASAVSGETLTVIGTVRKLKGARTWKRKMFITEALIEDESGIIRATWFNQPFLMNTLAEGKEIRLSGKISADKKGCLYFSNPAWEFSKREPTNTGRLVPVYPETEGLTSRWLRWQIGNFFKLEIDFADPLPEELLEKLHLPPLEKALKYIHFPASENQYLLARKRFAFEEMLVLQLKSLAVRSAWEKEMAVPIRFDEKLIKEFVSSLPFQLTDAQRKASFAILKDLEKARPMNRLLNGDVGSGKTVVAALAALQIAGARYQTALMAPTEVLARQHFESFGRLFRNHKIEIGLLTNAYKRSNYQPKPNSQSITLNADVVIGTHALIQKDVKFKNLALVIVDEQHRFGVAQRAYLQQEIATANDGLKGKIPHLLTMTATPIPRTLALAFFGNLDLSLLDEMPKDRKPIITQIIAPRERGKNYAFIREEIREGRQAFIILPLVEESKILTEVKAAVAEHKILEEKIFPDLKLGLVHGRMKAEEKEKVMRDFRERKTDILVATPVIEVGIDIPNATIIVIEDADRFGLSQLHQFRGRVGRGEHQSYCFLFAGAGKSANERLKALAATNDGFKIAEKDLALRGPGEFLGTRQSGIPDIAMENLTNVKLITIAREEAENILKKDPVLKKHRLLSDALKKFDRNVHLE